MIDATERRTYTLALRKAGVSYRDIADAVVNHFGIANLPKGYDSRYAYKDVMRWIHIAREEMREGAHDILELELKRLDELMFALWDRAIQGEFKAVDRVLKIMERRAKILGLDKTNLYLEADWRKEAAKKGVSAGEIFEQLVSAYVERIEEGAVDAEFSDVPIRVIEAKTSGGSVGGSPTEGDTPTESRAEVSEVSEDLPE